MRKTLNIISVTAIGILLTLRKRMKKITRKIGLIIHSNIKDFEKMKK